MAVYIEEYLETVDYIGYMWRVVLIATGEVKRSKFLSYSEALGWATRMHYKVIARP